MDIFEFMARMLYFLPDHHQKSIRYYGIYAQSKRRTVDYDEPVSCTWSRAIEKSFEKKPELCPDCKKPMVLSVVFAGASNRLIFRIRKTHLLFNGYFQPIRAP